MRNLTQDILISNEIRYMIDHKPYEEGEKLPSERALAEIFNVQRLTIRSALKLLVQEGWIIAKERSGYYVAKRRIEKNISRLESTTNVVKAMGKSMVLKVLSMKIIELNKKLSMKMKLLLGTKVFEFIKLREIEGEPVSIEKAYIPIDIAKSLNKENLEKRSLYEVLETEYNIKFEVSQQEILVVYANEEESKYLKVNHLTPLVKQQGIVYDKEMKKKIYQESIMLMDRFIYVKEEV